MIHRPIANTGILVSPLGLGTVKFGRNQGVKYPQAFDLPDDKTIQNLLSLAYDHGVNLLDTAPAYGLAEERLGKLLPHARHNWVIETKVGENFIDGESSFNFSAIATKKSIENSLRKLKTDYLDIVLIHSDGDDVRILQEEDVLNTLLEMKQAGLIRAVGISSKTVEGGLLAYKLNCDVVMATYNPSYTSELPVLEVAKKENHAIFIKKAFSSGHLNKTSGIELINDILEFIFAYGVTSIALGTINEKHLKDNIFVTNNILKRC